MSNSFGDTCEDLREELREWAADNPTETEPHDQIHELADGGVPIYTYTLMQWAAEHLDFATNEPELGPAFDGSPTPVNIIAANIYEAIEQELWEEWSDIEDEIIRECPHCHEDDDIVIKDYNNLGVCFCNVCEFYSDLEDYDETEED